MSSKDPQQSTEPICSDQCPIWLTQIDHTADAGIAVTAENGKDLFARAAWGMFSLIVEMNTIRTLEETEFVIQALDLDTLMVRWLSELNYKHITEYWLFNDFNILKLDENNLTACVKGEKIDPTRHTIYTEIKAVTFHGLTVVKENDHWQAQIIFDL